jgi:hypothetical protein
MRSTPKWSCAVNRESRSFPRRLEGEDGVERSLSSNSEPKDGDDEDDEDDSSL